ncbi:hypothetical protein D9619_004699 [Psilocybe cf. subviscida]|uniref:DUF6534 domain-containing protein n=1 Tax=Psilocybe cf. subviscida TaxID=2480587 RepID=A0A8H5BQL1_9AGAR|nr:hypothetical protein D9619_004699 [Psilocybe cf. subviscida]
MTPSAFFLQSDANLGAIEIAASLGLVLLGILLVQGYTYFRTSEGDFRGLKIPVGTLLAIETFHSFTASHTVYNETVTRWDRAQINSYSLCANMTGGTYITAFVQGFLSYRLYRISGGKKSTSLLCLWLASLRFILGMVMSAECNLDVRRTPNWVGFVTRFSWLIVSTLAVGAAADVAIACSMLYYLWTLAPSGNTTLTATIRRWSLRSGLVASFFSVGVLICFVAMSNLVWVGLYIILVRVYAISFLALLNARPRERRSLVRPPSVSTNTIYDTVPASAAPTGVPFSLAELPSGAAPPVPSTHITAETLGSDVPVADYHIEMTYDRRGNLQFTER